MADDSRPLTLIDAFVRNQSPYLQGSITHADSKANFLIAVTGIVLAFMETQSPLVDRIRTALEQNGWQSVSALLSLLSALSLLLGAGCAVLCVYPRYSSSRARNSSSFFEIADAYKTSEEFVSQMFDRTDQDVVKQQLRLHHYRCQICASKWRVLTLAYVFSILGALIFVPYFALKALLP